MSPWRVVLTREAGFNDDLATLFSAAFTVDEVPLTMTRFDEVSLVDERLRASADYGTFASLVVTSRRAAPYLSLCRSAVTTTCDVFTVGAATTSALEAVGFTVTTSTTEGVATLAPDIVNGPVLILGARHPFGDLAGALQPRLNVTSVACYETMAATLRDEDAALLGGADAVVIAAPSAWAVAQPYVHPRTWVLVPGDSTRQAVAATHDRVVRAWGPAMASTLRPLLEISRREKN